MKLLLTSEGITNTSIANAFAELLGNPFNHTRVIYVPTAANREEGDKGWVDADMDTIRKLTVLSFDVVDISIAPKDTWLPLFEKADAIVFGGGHVGYLLEWLEKSGVKKVLPSLLASRVYVGFSAGSMATAKTVSLSQADLLYYEKNGSIQSHPGLGFVDFEILPHFNAKDFPNVTIEYLSRLANKFPTPFYAIDNNTAIKVVDDKVSVISEGTWKRFH